MLDAAELLFALHGYHGTSMRDVAKASNARVALVTYHFGTKDSLLSKVVERRASHLAHQRMLNLEVSKTKVQPDPIPLDELVAGYVWPFIERSVHGGEGWKNYSLLVARMGNTPDWAKVISDYFDPTARKYLLEFRRSLPQVAEEDIYHAFSFMVGTMLAIVAEPRRVENLSFRKFKSTRIDRIYKRALPFLIGGFRFMPPKD